MRLECSQICYTYPGTDITVLDRVSFAFSKPGFHSIFGPSGVGKSSFAKLLATKEVGEKTYDGEIVLSGIKTILYSYNLERLPGWSSAGKHLSKVVSKEKNNLKEELIETFGLKTLLNSRFNQLSMGQQNRMNLIRYLLQDFDMLILDECLANVDEKLRETIILNIKRLFPDKMFLYISHNLMEVSTFCDEIMVFGSSAKKKSYSLVYGQNSTGTMNKEERDSTMLEIMNSF
ncbi:MAG: ATP-binding cassette domain-containing protein [Desulfotalea sp.]